MKLDCKLGSLCAVIQPQVGVNLTVKSASSGKILWEGPAHYLSAGQEICKKPIKTLRIESGSYCIGV